MQNLTPNWDEICIALVHKLDEVADEVDFSLEEGADSMFVASNAINELKLFIEAIESDPGQFSVGDAS